jgi:small subunit ribosomal protein S10e
MVAPKEFEIKHPELDIPNLQVVKACQSLTSKGFVHTQFSWQWYFYTLTDEVRIKVHITVIVSLTILCLLPAFKGLEYLREYLHLPAEIVPATHKRPARPSRPAGVAGRGEGGAYRAPRPDRDGGDNAYRKKDQAPSGEFRPRFGGVGRGAPRTE